MTAHDHDAPAALTGRTPSVSADYLAARINREAPLPEGTPEPAAVAACTRAAAQAAEVLARLDAARRTLEADRTRTPEARNRELVALRKELEEKLGRALDAAHRRAEQEAQTARAGLKDAIRRAAPREAEEIRAFVRTLAREERGKFLTARLEEGDASTLAAVLAAPEYLSGLGSAEAAHLTRRAEGLFDPGRIAQARRLEAAAAGLAYTAEIALRRIAETGDEKAAQAADRAREAADAALRKAREAAAERQAARELADAHAALHVMADALEARTAPADDAAAPQRRDAETGDQSESAA